MTTKFKRHTCVVCGMKRIAPKMKRDYSLDFNPTKIFRWRCKDLRQCNFSAGITDYRGKKL